MINDLTQSLKGENCILLKSMLSTDFVFVKMIELNET